MKDKYLGFFALLGTSFIYGIFGVIARALGPYLTANQMTFSRSVVVAVILLITLFYKKISLINIPKNLFLPLFVHSVTFGATIFLFTYAVFSTSLSKATFSFYSTTLLTSLLVSTFVFREKLSLRKGFSFALAMCALIFYILPTGIKSIEVGMLFTAIAGISDVVTNSMKKYLGGKLDRLVLVFYQMITGIIFGFLLILANQEFTLARSLDFNGIAWLLFFSLNFFLLSYLTAYGFQHFDLNLGTIILSMEFVFASLVGFFLYNEMLSIYQVVASGLLIGSIVIMNLPEKAKLKVKKKR